MVRPACIPRYTPKRLRRTALEVRPDEFPHTAISERDMAFALGPDRFSLACGSMVLFIPKTGTQA
jgi:hypothetical protein